MRILFLNPNVSASMTDRVVEQARRACPSGWTVTGATACRGVAVVATRASYALAAASTLETWAMHEEDASWRADAVVVACFGDPGVVALRELATAPVHGLAEASLRACVEAGHRRVAIVTAGLQWRCMLDELVEACGLGAVYAGTFAIDATGLGAIEDPARAQRLLQAEVDAARAAGADAIVLGGAALAGWTTRLASSVPLVDCVAATMETLRRDAGAASRPSDRAAVVPIDSKGLPAALAARLSAPREGGAA